MRPSLVTNLAAQRVPDTSARPDWTRTAGSSSSSAPCLSTVNPGLGLEHSGGVGTDGGEEKRHRARASATGVVTPGASEDM
jgi:hypothetical protein